MSSKDDFQIQMKQKVQNIEGILQEYLPKQKGRSEEHTSELQSRI